ncbi:MAG: response regulator transcription factor [Chloroflexota bacterium]|nr:response regulator transcription factor [Chloroflexota bacterium]
MNYVKQPILLVDDDPGILVAVKQALVAQGYEVTTATNGLEALKAFEDKPPELVLLDLMLPRCDGREVCRSIRERSDTPIIVISVRGSEAEVVSVLDLGADDYLVKPFRLAELLARVRALLRRTGKSQTNKLVCGALEIDTERRRVTVAGRDISLTPIEYTLLTILAANMGRVLTTQLLLQRVWGLQYSNSTEYVKVVIRRLRAKLEPDPAHPQYIITEPHLGYRMNDLGTSVPMEQHAL